MDFARCQDRAMSESPQSRSVLSKNLDELMKSHPSLSSNHKLAKATSLGVGTIARLRNGEVAATIDTVDIVAKAFQLESWQLIAPALGSQPSMRAAYEFLRGQVEGG